MAFEDHFSTLAARYATYRPRYPPALVELLADLAPAHALAWDAGCGTGQLSVALAARFGRVIATEPAAAQLADAEPHARVEYRQEPAEASTLADASADLAVAAQAAHWFDWSRYVAEVARVAKPGALVGVVTYGDNTVEGVAGPVVAAHIAAVAPYWPAGRAHVTNYYRDLVWPWPALATPSLELTADWTREELGGYLATSSAAARERAATGPGRLEALVRALEAVLPDPTTRVRIRWPLTANLAHRPKTGLTGAWPGC